MFSFAQNRSKFNFEIEYNYLFGVSEKGKFWDFNRSDAKMYGNSIRLKGIYNINPIFSTGLGVGSQVLENPRYSTIPVFALIEVRPFHTYMSPYLFSNIGYSISTDYTNGGLLTDLGIGYKKMFRKHFGLDFRIGYNLTQIRYDVNYYEGDRIGSSESSSNIRHSISAGFGLVF